MTEDARIIERLPPKPFRVDIIVLFDGFNDSFRLLGFVTPRTCARCTNGKEEFLESIPYFVMEITLDSIDV